MVIYEKGKGNNYINRRHFYGADNAVMLTLNICF